MKFARCSLARWGILVVALVGCSSGDDTSAPAGRACAAGFREVADGSGCEPIVPASDCAAGTMPLFGLADCQPVGWTDCPAGFEADPSGWGCREILPQTACPNGTMPVLGKTTCQPVGWTTCPSGFEPDPSGWGCRDVLPADPCTGATRASLGSTTCQPVGSCTAAFPPPDATLFVDDSLTQNDATHFTTISAALAKAQDGDVIAIEAGTYAEGMVATHSVTLVGRCPEQVVLDGSGKSVPGVDAEIGSLKVTVRGVTLHNHLTGAAALSGAEIDISDTVIDGARQMGLFAADSGTIINAARTVVRGTLSDASGSWGYGADAEGGGTVHVEDSELSDNRIAAMNAITHGAVDVKGSAILRTMPDATGIFGHGIHVESAGEATVTGSAIADSGEIGVYVDGDGSTATLTDTIVRDTKPASSGQTGIGVQADVKGKVSLTRCALAHNTFMGLILFDAGASAVVTDSVVRDTQPLAGSLGGRGLMAEDGPTLTVSGTAVVDNHEYGIVAGGANTTLALSGSLVKGTQRANGGRYGWGVNVSDGGHIAMKASAIVDNQGCGVALTNAKTSGDLESSIVTGTERAPGVMGDAPDYLVTGIAVAQGASANLKACALVANRNVGLYATGIDEAGTPATVNADALLVRGTLPADTVGPGNSAGVIVAFGANATITSGALIDNSTVGFVATEPGAIASLANAVISGTLPNNDGIFGRGVIAQTGGAVTVDHTALVDNHEIALYLTDQGASATVTRTFIADTQPDINGETGWGISVQFSGQLSLAQSTIVRGHDVGLNLAGDAAAAIVTDALIGSTALQMSDQNYGHGVLVAGNASLQVQRSRIFGNAGVGLAFSDSTGAVSATDVADNTIGIQAQDGTTLEEASRLPSALVDHQVIVTKDVRFISNVERVGSGSLPIPEPVGSVPDQPPPPTPKP